MADRISAKLHLPIGTVILLDRHRGLCQTLSTLARLFLRVEACMAIADALRARKLSKRGGAQARWIVVAILFFVSALNYGDRSAISSVFPLLQHDFHLSDLQIGLLGTAFLWAYAIGVPFGGYLGDTLSRSKIVTISLTGWSVATLAAVFSRSFPQLVLCRVLLGLTESFYIPSALALIADYHETDTRGTALSLNLSGMSVGLIASAVLSGWLAERYGWRQPFLLLGILGLCLAPVSWLFVNDADSNAVRETHDSQRMTTKLAQLLKNRSYILVVVEGVLTSCGSWMFWTWLPLYYHEAFHMNLSASGFSGTFMLQSAATAAIVIGGYFSDRIGAAHPKRRLLALSLFYFASVPFFGVFYGHQSYFVVSGGIFLASFIRTFGQGNEQPIICELLPPQVRSTALGMLLASEMAGGGVAVLFAGYVKQNHGLSFAFLCISLLVLLAALSALVAYLFYFDRDLARRSDGSEPHVYPVRVEPAKGISV
jgi:MFS transporter, Spinster family, sphingosine-1-phosphate transporter